MKAVVLAGGKGTRLQPYTTVFPKPLMPIGDRPILEIIVQQLQNHGFDELILTIGYLGEMVKAFFGDAEKYRISIKYFKEEKPLGTAGALGLLKEELRDTFLMMNGDILTTLDYSDLVSSHLKSGAIATVAIKKRQIYIDFGVVDFNSGEGLIKDYIEKPTLEKLVSMGICVLQPDMLRYIEPNKHLDFPELIKKLIAKGERVNGYIYDGYWLDIGRPEDYEKANAEFDEIYSQLGIEEKDGA